MLPIFTYGALMYQPIWLSAVEHHCNPIPAVAQGYLRVSVNDSQRCSLVTASPQARVSGMLYAGLNLSHVRALDDYIGELFERKEIEVITASETYIAQSYMLKDKYSHFLRAYNWDQREFERKEVMSLVAAQSSLPMADLPKEPAANFFL